MQLRNMACAPLLSLNGKCVGVLQLLNKASTGLDERTHSFSQMDVALLESLAVQIGLEVCEITAHSDPVSLHASTSTSVT